MFIIIIIIIIITIIIRGITLFKSLFVGKQGVVCGPFSAGLFIIMSYFLVK